MLFLSLTLQLKLALLTMMSLSAFYKYSRRSIRYIGIVYLITGQTRVDSVHEITLDYNKQSIKAKKYHLDKNIEKPTIHFFFLFNKAEV